MKKFAPAPPRDLDPSKEKDLDALLDERASLEAKIIDLTSRIRELMEEVK